MRTSNGWILLSSAILSWNGATSKLVYGGIAIDVGAKNGISGGGGTVGGGWNLDGLFCFLLNKWEDHIEVVFLFVAEV